MTQIQLHNVVTYVYNGSNNGELNKGGWFICTAPASGTIDQEVIKKLK